MSTLTAEYQKTSFRKPDRLYTGLDAAVNSAIGVYHRRAARFRQMKEEAEQADRMAPEFLELTDRQLQERLLSFREVFRRGGRRVDSVLLPALAAIREASDRTIGLRPFLVQILGALAMYRGCLAEMATGEGKTLTAGLTGVLWGWSRHPCHVVTVNDYLVERDARWLSPLYHFCGVRVGYILAPMAPEERAKNYQCDITYTSSKEVTADFLRDCLKVGEYRDPTRRLIRQWLNRRSTPGDGLVQRGLHSAIVDEADSVLIDEAVTPLIISTMRKNESLREVARMAQEIAAPLLPDIDYTVNRRYREIDLTSQGKERLEHLCAGLPGMWKGPARRVELIRQALVAREFYKEGKQYIVVDGKVVIVDEFTGRQMPQRTWRQGMHQAIEAKEGLEISDPTDTIARISFQRYYRLYHRLSGMTGTATEAAFELWQIYRLPVVAIPPNRPCIRKQAADRMFVKEADKWDAVVEDLRRLHSTGQPVLVGTRSVVASEKLAARLQDENIPYKLLNAVRHEEEAVIVAVAGEKGHVTIATNMARRGTVIKLGEEVAGIG